MKNHLNYPTTSNFDSILNFQAFLREKDPDFLNATTTSNFLPETISDVNDREKPPQNRIHSHKTRIIGLL